MSNASKKSFCRPNAPLLMSFAPLFDDEADKREYSLHAEFSLLSMTKIPAIEHRTDPADTMFAAYSAYTPFWNDSYRPGVSGSLEDAAYFLSPKSSGAGTTEIPLFCLALRAILPDSGAET
jgi:hypothetical protein